MKKNITTVDIKDKTNKEALIRKIQLVNLKSLKKLDEICRKYQIQYWAAYGTLLGTIRHQGFIPWDDDVDIQMLREDYEKLQKVPVEEWGPGCLFATGYTEDLRHDKVFGRVYQKNTQIQSYNDVESWKNPKTQEAWSTSLMLDVYVMDHVPDDEQARLQIYDQYRPKAIHDYKPSKLEYVAHKKGIHAIKDHLKKKKFDGLRKGKSEPWVSVMEKLDHEIQNSQKGKRIGSFYTNDPYVYEEADIFPLQRMKYEDMEIPVPKNYEKMLVDMYGDYMQFPPEEDRIHIHFIYADLAEEGIYVVDPIPGSLGEKALKNQTD